MKTPDSRRQAQVFAEFIGDKRILIADPSSTSRATLAGILVKMGAKTTHIILASNFATAEAEIDRGRPQIVVADFNLGKRCGLNLLQRQRSRLAGEPDMKDALFVLVTGNTSQSAVARAAEEDIDTYIIKPFTAEVFRDSIIRATLRKIEPTQYHQLIAQAKQQMSDGKIDEAIGSLERAAGLDNSPALALYYLGQAQDIKRLLEQAEGRYNQGLEFNKIHYKCLVGLYENLMGRKKHANAYEIIKRISHYFPANPQRLTAVLRLAIMTQSYEDVERYYRIFTGIDERNEEMIKYICAALVVCGKYYLHHDHRRRALELFQKAAITASGRTRILREIILALTDCGLAKEAEEFLKRFPPASQKATDFLAMELLVASELGQASKTIENGRALLAGGHHDPVIYRVMIQRSIAAGLRPAAEDLLRDALQRYPEQKDAFEKAMGSSRPVPAEAKR